VLHSLITAVNSYPQASYTRLYQKLVLDSHFNNTIIIKANDQKISYMLLEYYVI
jgi:hypothetical protein